MEKMTNKKALEFALGLQEIKDNQEVFEKLTKMLEQVEKKNGSVDENGKKILSVDQQKNQELKTLILSELANTEEPLQIKDMIEQFTCLKGKGYSNQKISALLRQLLLDGLVVKVEEKRVSRFTIA